MTFELNCGCFLTEAVERTDEYIEKCEREIEMMDSELSDPGKTSSIKKRQLTVLVSDYLSLL